MELHLDRKLSERRVFPAIEINRSGTRKEELLLSKAEMMAVYTLRKAYLSNGISSDTESFVNRMMKTKSNDEFISTINQGYRET